MQKKAGKACAGLRWGVVFSLITAIAAVSVSADPADARAKRKRGKAVAAAPYSPPYSDIVIDANSGAVLHSVNPDASRHPASLTKIMTLYLLFEQLEAGKITLKTELPVSAHAASQAPSKLNLKPGQTISVEDAIKATVTKSANDVAVVIAESVGGDEGSFARSMTAKARAIGMQNTVYKNASGLPDDAQITTARDQALLGRAIQDRFPKYYTYFSTTRFTFRGKTIAGHNRLVGSVEGVDGIKTGYVNASGFNLVTSMRRNGRHVVGVVLGGHTARARDAKMRELITDKIQVASTKRTAPMLAEAPPAEPKRSVASRIAAAVITPARADINQSAAVPLPRPAPVATVPANVAPFAVASAAPVPPAPIGAAPGSSDPLEPIAVKTLAVKQAGIQNVALGGPHVTASVPAKGQELAFADPAQDRHSGVLGTLTMSSAPAHPVAQPLPPAPQAAADLLRPTHRTGWMIQVGAFDREDDAKSRLGTAQSRAKPLLGSAEPFTERVVKGDKTLYRARFAGLEKDQAEAACQYLKKNEIACMALKN